MHWVAAEAVGAAAVMYRVTGDRTWAERYEQWWEYISTYLLDAETGSWFHELDGENQPQRSEEHTSELQSRGQLVCRLLLEKKKENKTTRTIEATRSHLATDGP